MAEATIPGYTLDGKQGRLIVSEALSHAVQRQAAGPVSGRHTIGLQKMKLETPLGHTHGLR